MSAECSKCGADLDYYLNCGRCTQRERAEKAEARVRQLEHALRGLIRVTELPGTRSAIAPEMERAKSIARAALSTSPHPPEEEPA